MFMIFTVITQRFGGTGNINSSSLKIRPYPAYFIPLILMARWQHSGRDTQESTSSIWLTNFDSHFDFHFAQVIIRLTLNSTDAFNMKALFCG